MTQAFGGGLLDPQHPNDPVVTEYAKAQREEYGTYVATEDIVLENGALMATRGSTVLKSTAERLGWHQDGDAGPAKVVKRDSAAGKRMLQEIGLAPAEETTAKAAPKAATTKAGSN